MIAGISDAKTLAGLISNVTVTMCGLSFEPAVPQAKSPELWWKIATLQITGDRPVLVTLSSDRKGCEVLGSALLGCPPNELDGSMMEDSLCELLNMAAGQIKSALCLDQALGLPSIVTLSELERQAGTPPPGIVLRGRGAVDIVLWISDLRS